MSISASLEKRFSLRSVLSYDYTGGGIYVVSGEAAETESGVLRFFCAEATEGVNLSDITFYERIPADLCDLTAEYDKYILGSYAEGSETWRQFWLAILAEEFRSAIENKSSASDIERMLGLLPSAKKSCETVLSGKTAAGLKEGDVLRFGSELELVTAILPVMKGGVDSHVMGYRISMMDCRRRMIRLEKASSFYGAEIVRQVSDCAPACEEAEAMPSVGMILTYEEASLLFDILLNVRANGNTVFPSAFDPSPAQYKTACAIASKLDYEAQKLGIKKFSSK